jgi:hypothetical protein
MKEQRMRKNERRRIKQVQNHKEHLQTVRQNTNPNKAFSFSIALHRMCKMCRKSRSRNGKIEQHTKRQPHDSHVKLKVRLKDVKLQQKKKEIQSRIHKTATFAKLIKKKKALNENKTLLGSQCH